MTYVTKSWIKCYLKSHTTSVAELVGRLLSEVCLLYFHFEVLCSNDAYPLYIILLALVVIGETRVMMY
jgi:hypothetical protein